MLYDATASCNSQHPKQRQFKIQECCSLSRTYFTWEFEKVEHLLEYLLWTPAEVDIMSHVFIASYE